MADRVITLEQKRRLLQLLETATFEFSGTDCCGYLEDYEDAYLIELVRLDLALIEN